MAGMADICYYDGRCGLCRGATRVLRWMDWFGALRFVDMGSVPDSELPVSRALAMQGMPMRTGRGVVLVGFAAVRRALGRTPLGALPALVMRVPGIAMAGSMVYCWVARRRPRGACSATAADG